MLRRSLISGVVQFCVEVNGESVSAELTDEVDNLFPDVRFKLGGRFFLLKKLGKGGGSGIEVGIHLHIYRLIDSSIGLSQILRLFYRAKIKELLSLILMKIMDNFDQG